MEHCIHQLMLRGDVRKLLWFLGLSFVVVLLVQFSEIPFGNLFSLMFLSSKSPPSEMVDNITLSSDLIPNNGTVQESDLSSNRSASGDLLMKESIIGPSKGGYAPNEAMMRHIGTSIGNLPSPAPAPSLPPRGTDNGSSINDLMSSPTPVFHQPSGVLQGIYASEGWFMKQLEENKEFVTVNATKAHLFYLPFSARMLEETLYIPRSHSRTNLVQYLKDYLDLIGTKYPYWNRTGGTDHFLAGCHDWAPKETKEVMANCIRALCNANAKKFHFVKDVSIPTTYIHNPQDPLKGLGGNPPSKRSVLAFFAGNMHGYVRPVLLQYWKNDPDMKIYGPLPKIKGQMSYSQHMKSSKYCICPRGFEVNSPRVVESIFYECVPVIISDNYVPPFFNVLDWKSFAVFVLEKDIPNLKKILSSISEKRYSEMQYGVKKVQQHFLWHLRPVKYDIFHMILHSVWYNRVLQMNPR